MIKKAKGLDQMKFIFITDLNTFDSNVFLTLKIMDSKNVTLTCSYLCERGHECII